jgi:histidine ammonia-lyase
LALINGTQCMTAIGTLVWYDLDRGAKLADITAWNSDVAGDHCALEGSNCTFVMKEGIIYRRS